MAMPPLPSALEGRKHLVDPLSFGDNVDGFCQKYKLSRTFLIRWVALPLISGLGLVFFGKATAAVLAGKVLVGIAALACIRQAYIAGSEYFRLYGTSGVLVPKRKDSTPKSTELIEAIKATKVQKQQAIKSQRKVIGQTGTIDRSWLRCAIAKNPDLLTQADSQGTTPLMLAEQIDDDDISAALIQVAIDRKAAATAEAQPPK